MMISASSDDEDDDDDVDDDDDDDEHLMTKSVKSSQAKSSPIKSSELIPFFPMEGPNVNATCT